MGRFQLALLIWALGPGCTGTLAPTTSGMGGRGGSAPTGGLTGRAGAPGTGAGGGGADMGIGGAGAETGIGAGGLGGDAIGASGEGGDRPATTGLGGAPATGSGGAVGGAPATGSGGAVGGVGPLDGGARDGGSSFCPIPSAPQAGWTDITVTWCDAAQTCASCSWATGAYGIGSLGVPEGGCAFPDVLCPIADSQTVASGGIFPVCTAHPDGEVYDGVLVQLVGVTLSPDGVTQASSCSGLDHQGSGNLPDFNFDVTPCGLNHFTCVADCSACPSGPAL